MKYTEPLLFFLGSFAALALFSYIAHIIYKFAESEGVAERVSYFVPAVLFIGVLVWFGMVMRSIYLLVSR